MDRKPARGQRTPPAASRASEGQRTIREKTNKNKNKK
jgi:hypothetical protein